MFAQLNQQEDGKTFLKLNQPNWDSRPKRGDEMSQAKR